MQLQEKHPCAKMAYGLFQPLTLMDKAQDTATDIDVTHGHLSVRVEGAHPPEVRFAFSQQPRRTSFSVATGALLQAALLFLFIFVNRLPHLKLSGRGA